MTCLLWNLAAYLSGGVSLLLLLTWAHHRSVVRREQRNIHE